MAELLLELLADLDEPRFCELLPVRADLLAHEGMELFDEAVEFVLDQVHMVVDCDDIAADQVQLVSDDVQPILDGREIRRLDDSVCHRHLLGQLEGNSNGYIRPKQTEILPNMTKTRAPQSEAHEFIIRDTRPD